MKKFLASLLCVMMLITSLSVGVFAAGGEGTPEMPTPKITYDVSMLNPSVSAQTINAGDIFNISFTLNGNCVTKWVYSDGTEVGGSHNWDSNVRTTVSVSGNGFTLAGSLAEQELHNGYNTIAVLSDSSLKTGRYQVTLNVSCNGASDSRTFNIDVEESEVQLDEENDAPKFTLSSASIPEGKGKSDLSTKLNIKLKNDTDYQANDVTVTLTGMGELILNTFTDTVNIGSVDSGEEFTASFPIKFPEYPSLQTTLSARVTYKDNSGNTHEDSFNIYLQSREKEKEENKDDKALEPKVIVSNYSVDVEKIISGDEFVLTFVLKNTSHDRDVMNMTVDVDTMSSGNSGNGATNETVFSPIDGTTSFYTEKLVKDGELEYTIRLKTSASAGAKSYPVKINYDFQYENNGVYVSSGGNSMTINLPVTQPIKFELMEWYPPTECPTTGCAINFQYFNKSKNPMTNLAVSMEGDFTMPTQYVGTLNASSYDFFNATITPNDPAAVGETKKAILVFTFEDASSNEQRVEYPFDVLVTEAAAVDPGFNGGMVPGGELPVDPGIMDPGADMPMDPSVDASGEGTEGGLPSWAMYAIGGGIILVVIAVIVIIVVVSKKRKAALYEEEDE